MVARTARAWFLALVCVGLTCVAPALSARTLDIRAARLQVAGATLERLQVRMRWPEAGGAGTMTVHIARLRVSDLGLEERDVRWRCVLRARRPSGWRCEGPLQAAGHGASATLSVQWSPAATDAVLAQGPHRIAVTRLAATPAHTRVDLHAVPLPWLQPLLATVWAEGRLQGGAISGQLLVATPATAGMAISGRLQAREIGIDTARGDIAAQGVDLALAVDYTASRTGPTLTVQGDAQDGEALFGTTYVQLPATPSRFAIRAAHQTGGWALPTVRWEDGRTLRVDGAMALDRNGALRSLSLDAASEDLAPLPQRYLSGWLGAVGLSQLRMRGAARVALTLDADGLAAARVELDRVDADDSNAHFGLHGLDGAVRYSAVDATESRLDWQGGRMYDIDFGPGQLPLVSASGVLQATDAVEVGLLGGKATLEGLQVRPPRAGRGTEFDLSLDVDAIEMPQLARALGWPSFRGTLSGRIPSVRYRSPTLSFDGGLEAQAFDGRVVVSDLRLQHPFGAHPTLAANVALRGLDLQHLTDVFGFGSMQGRLDGEIRDLSLLDWQPQRFDGEIHTVPVRGVPQRISQRAVQDLSSLGGGLGGGLQALFLGYFEEFGYARIGLSCQLRGSVCRMDGLRPQGQGFMIVEGRGVPRLDVVGFNHLVDWPTLLQRLAEVARGESAPRIE